MQNSTFLRPRLLVFAIACIFIVFSSKVAFAQSELSTGLSDPLSQSTATSGLNGTFDPETGNLTNPELHTDVSDPTHSQLLGSSLSPANTSYAFSIVSSAPETGTLTDAQTAIGAGSPAFGGRQSRSFAAGENSGMLSGGANRQVTAGVLGLGSMQASFAGGVMSRSAFSGEALSRPGTALSFSGQGIPVPSTPSGVGPTRSPATSTGSGSNLDANSQGYTASDPVLSGDTSGYEVGLQVEGDMPPPSSGTGPFFAEAATNQEPRFQYDDGQTPLGGIAARSGEVIGAAPEYGPSPTGFPDSTRGMAGLQPEVAASISIFHTPGSATSSPFAPVSEGSVFGPKLLFTPNLHAPALSEPVGAFAILERRAQEQRILHGMSISQSNSIYEEDLRNYQRNHGQIPRSSQLDVGNPAYPGAETFLSHRVIR